MKIRKLMMGLAAAFIVAGLQSCTGARPANNDGHNLWLGDITTGVENVKTVILDRYDNALGDEGFRIGFAGTGRENATVYANTKVAAMYGAYHLDRLDKCGMLPTSADAEIVEVPAYRYRLLNHWDNPNGTVERGYAGQSLWKWNELPGTIRPEYEEYARANASLGINGTVLNNVNADARMLTREYLDKVKVLADIFRPYGIKVGVICPGGVKTEFALGKGRTEQSVAESGMLDPEDVASAVMLACTQSPKSRIIQVQMRTMDDALA